MESLGKGHVSSREMEGCESLPGTAVFQVFDEVSPWSVNCFLVSGRFHLALGPHVLCYRSGEAMMRYCPHRMLLSNKMVTVCSARFKMLWPSGLSASSWPTWSLQVHRLPLRGGSNLPSPTHLVRVGGALASFRLCLWNLGRLMGSGLLSSERFWGRSENLGTAVAD